MLPKPIKNSKQKQRSHAIADLLLKSDYDIIFLQEAFSPYFRRIVKNAIEVKYPYYKRLKKKFGLYPIMGQGHVFDCQMYFVIVLLSRLRTLISSWKVFSIV